MKLIATFEENKPVEIMRYENELNVGKKRVDYEQFVKGLATELSLPSLLTLILKRHKDFKEYLKLAKNDNFGLFETFMDALINELDKEKFIEPITSHPLLVEKLAKYHSTVDLVTPSGIEFLKRSIRSLDNVGIAQSKELLDLARELTRRLVHSEVPEIRRDYAEIVYYVSANAEKDKLKNLIESFLPTFEENWLRQVFHETFKEKDALSNPVRSSVSIPKKCVWIQTHECSIKYVIEIPKAQLRVGYHDVKFEHVGHPRLLSIIEVDNKNQVTNMKMVAIKEKDEINLSTSIFKYPYSNVFRTGEVCWHGYKGPVQGDISYLPSLFLSTPNNAHLESNVLGLFKKNEGKDFSDEELKPMEDKKLVTLADVL